MKKLLAFIGVIFAHNFALAQSPLVIENDTKVLYEQSMDANRGASRFQPLWKNLQPWSGKFIKRADGQQLYIFEKYKVVLDSASLASAYTDNEALTMKIEGSQKPLDFKVGNAWRVVFDSPKQPPEANCDARYDYKFVVKSTEKAEVIISNKLFTTEKTTIEGEGWWNACGFSGKIFKRVVYLPEIQIVFSEEIVVFDPAGNLRLGRAMFLKQIQ